MKNVFDDVVAAIGGTPMVRINRLTRGFDVTIYAKLEFLNPGSSIKDRIAVQMVDDAEREGRLKPGGTLVECTSGNTGMGLALVGAARGYHAILVMPDKVSDEKIKALRAFGAKVVTTPTAVAPEDPRSYYQVARRIAETTPNALFINQYQNPSNPEAHFRTTGPEIWEQMGEKLDAVVVASGTGGTITGISRFLKSKKPSIKMVLVDPVGSIYYHLVKTGKMPKEINTYKVEGFGEDFVPGSIDLKLVDDAVQVSDAECFQMARELTRKEGLFGGGSCGGAMVGALKYSKAHPECKTMVVILPDSGSRYLSKVYDDAWMKENSFLDESGLEGKVRDLLDKSHLAPITVRSEETVSHVIALMKKHGISQIPVLENEKLIGMVSETGLLGTMLETPDAFHRPVGSLVEPNFAVVEPSAPISRLWEVIADGKVALVMEEDRLDGVVTKFDLLEHLAASSR